MTKRKVQEGGAGTGGEQGPTEGGAGRRVEVRYVPPSDLHPHPRNPRVHPESSVAAVQKSIAKFGFVNPIIALPDGTIVAGEGRWRAATAARLDKVPVVMLDMTEQEALSYMVVDNALVELSDWDVNTLAEISADLKDGEWSLQDVSAEAFGYLEDWGEGGIFGEGGGEGEGDGGDGDPETTVIKVRCKAGQRGDVIAALRTAIKDFDEAEVLS